MTQDPPSAVVTGSTSGIGKAIAFRLMRNGYRIVLNYSSDDHRANATFKEAREAGGICALVRADIGRASEATALIRQATESFGSVDLLVNNAARVADAPALDVTEVEWDSVLNVNLKGAFLVAQAAARQMLSQDSGGIILNIGASTGIQGRRNGVNTCVSKAGLMIMTQCLALELAPNIRVNTIIPGLVVTEETRDRFGLDDLGARREREAAVPLRRLGQPDDVADAVMLAIATEARFITGQKITVNGGQYMW